MARNATAIVDAGTQRPAADEVVALLDAGRYGAALDAVSRLNAAEPGFGYGWYLASFALRKLRRFDAALDAIGAALALEGLDRYALHRARILHEAGDPERARDALIPLATREWHEADLHAEAGALCNALGRYAEARRHYARAVVLAPNDPEYRYNEAALARFSGDAAAAEAGFDATIALDPGQYEAYLARAQVRTQTRARNHVAELREAIERTRSAAGLVQLHHALAKELEDLGEYEASFEQLARGAALKRRHLRYRVDVDLEIMATIRSVYGRERLRDAPDGCPDAAPIFVIGMPRTGTTLVERILGSHSAVCAAGELNTFSLELMRATRLSLGAAQGSRADFVRASAGLDFRALGEAYVRRTQPFRDARPHFVDKLPFNFLYVGPIHLALPHARIVHLERDPLDTCYAVYKQLFKEAYPFSYDLEELAQYYVGYRRLMAHWDAVLPGKVHTVRYESLVADFEREAHRLLEYCGLPWEETCLRYHENPRESTTASALQVRQPIYDSSVGKWRRYARQLAPVAERLKSAGIDVR